MAFIDINWKPYFDNPHEGLGTTYERFILHELFSWMMSRFDIQSILEAPSFGMTGVSGINSLWWAQKKIKTTVCDHCPERLNRIHTVWQKLPFDADFVCVKQNYSQLPFSDNAFDLGWNFAALSYVADLPLFLKELTRTCKKTIFICMPNEKNIFCRLRMLSGNTPEEENGSRISFSGIEKIFHRLNWTTADRGYFDIPPWPDIAMKKEDLLKKVGLVRLAEYFENRNESPLCILDYFNGKEKDMNDKIMRFRLLENAPLFFQRLWAHHQYSVFIPK